VQLLRDKLEKLESETSVHPLPGSPPASALSHLNRAGKKDAGKDDTFTAKESVEAEGAVVSGERGWGAGASDSEAVAALVVALADREAALADSEARAEALSAHLDRALEDLLAASSSPPSLPPLLSLSSGIVNRITR